MKSENPMKIPVIWIEKQSDMSVTNGQEKLEYNKLRKIADVLDRKIYQIGEWKKELKINSDMERDLQKEYYKFIQNKIQIERNNEEGINIMKKENHNYKLLKNPKRIIQQSASWYMEQSTKEEQQNRFRKSRMKLDLGKLQEILKKELDQQFKKSKKNQKNDLEKGNFRLWMIYCATYKQTDGME